MTVDVPAALAAELAARTAWGELPALYLVGAPAARCELRPLTVPAPVWRTLGLHSVITATADGIAGLRRGSGQAHPDLVGAAVRYEDWDLPWPLLSGPALRPAMAALVTGTIQDRPDRIQTRFILAAGRDGTSWLARQHRHSPHPRAFAIPAGQSPPPLSPRVWSAIKHFTRTVLGPSGPEPER